MTELELELDTARATAATIKIFNGRDPIADYAEILATTEKCVATLLLIMFPDPKLAAFMLNEGLVQGIERRLSLHRSKMKETKP